MPLSFLCNSTIAVIIMTINALAAAMIAIMTMRALAAATITIMTTRALAAATIIIMTMRALATSTILITKITAHAAVMKNIEAMTRQVVDVNITPLKLKRKIDDARVIKVANS